MASELVNTLLGLSDKENIVIVNRKIVKFAGSLEAGMMLSQLMYWTPRARIEGGWIAKSDADWTEELMISRYAVRQSRAKLEELGILETETVYFAGHPTTHYRLRLEELEAKWTVWIQTVGAPLFENEQSTMPNQTVDCPKSDNVTDTTTEITETTTCSGSGEPDTTSSRKEPPRGYTDMQRDFLALFGSQRFKTRIQADTVAEMVDTYGKERVMELGIWAAKIGMNVGKAVVSVESRLQKESGNGRQKVLKVPVI